jgi:hypothetical protein
MDVIAKLNSLAKNLMDQVPNDIRSQTDNFVKEVAKSVKSELDESEKKLKEMEAELKALQQRFPKDGRKKVADELFELREHGSVEGTWPTLHRLSMPEKPLFCIRLKKHPEQPVVCGAHCAAFKILPDGNVEICNGSIREIKR